MQTVRHTGHGRPRVGCAGAPLLAQRRAPAVAPQRRGRQIVSVMAFSAAPDWNGRCFVALCTGEGATSHLAGLLAQELKLGDSLCLKGDKGAGKSLFA